MVYVCMYACADVILVCTWRPDLNPMTTEEIVQMFNELRSDLVLVYELKQALTNCEYEQQMLRHRYEALLKAGSGGGGRGIPGVLPVSTPQAGEPTNAGMGNAAPCAPGGEAQAWPGMEDIKVEAKEQFIDVVGAPLTPNSVSSSSSVRVRRCLTHVWSQEGVLLFLLFTFTFSRYITFLSVQSD